MSKLQIVFDTNVVISSLWPGTARRVLNLWRDEHVLALVSEPIVAEYLEVLGRFAIAPEDAQEFLALFTDTIRTKLVEPKERIKAVPADPSDDKFLECAVAGGADAIVSGDKHLKSLHTFRGVPILPPAAFISQYRL